MKIPKILAAITIATVLNSGALVAHAAGFTQSTNGYQKTEEYDNSTNGASNLSSQGDIEITGEFTKIINNFPDIKDEGRYLRVTMPLSLGFKYDVDTDIMTSAKGTIKNESVLAVNDKQGADVQKSKLTVTPKKVTMKFVGLTDNKSTLENIAFVDKVNEDDDSMKDKIQLPFKVNILTNGAVSKDYNLKDIAAVKDSNGPEIEIPANSSIQLELDKISKQAIGNKKLIKKETTLTNHALKLQFSYKG